MCVHVASVLPEWIFEYGENEQNIRINEKGWEACLLPMTFPRIPVCCIAPKPPTLPGTTPANSSVAANFDFSHPGCHWLIWNDTGGPVSNSCHACRGQTNQAGTVSKGVQFSCFKIYILFWFIFISIFIYKAGAGSYQSMENHAKQTERVTNQGKGDKNPFPMHLKAHQGASQRISMVWYKIEWVRMYNG